MIAIAVPTASATSDSPSAGKPVGSEGATLQAAGKAVPVSTPDEGKRSVDVRADTGADPVDPASPTATAALRGSLGSQGVLDIDPNTGTPRFLGRLDGFLTAPSSSSPQDVALGYARANAKALGLSTSDLGGLRLTRNYTDTSGITHLIWAQSVGGVEAFENGLYANVSKDGRLINLMGSPVAGLAGIRSLDPDLSARNALATALDNAGADRSVPAVRSTSGADQRTEFAGSDSARLVLFTGAGANTQLAWEVSAKASSTEIYEYVVDAGSGKVLLRQNTVDFAAGNVWEYAPQISDPAVCPECSAPAGTQSLHTFPAGWGTEATKLQGNNVHVYTDTNDNNLPDAPNGNCPECGEIGPSSGTNWNYAFQANPNPSALSDNCFTIFPQCSWSISNYGWRPNVKQNATQVYFYVNNFHDWLAGAPFGFTAAAGNFEGTDAVNAETLDGAATDTSAGAIPGTPDLDHINNANMNTPADGTPPRMQMYLFADLSGSSTPESNGGDDASVIYHEYTHGLSNRLVLDSAGNPALRAFQSRAMGEGWSDWYAMDYLEGHDLDETDTADNGEMNIGVYVMGGDIHNLRTEGLDCNRGTADADCPGAGNAGSGGYTLGDMGKILCDGFTCEPEFHADGEIWAQTLWDLRQRFVGDLGGGTLNGLGVTRARNVITRGMELAPPDPSYLEMRNAIIQADKVVYGGADKARLWAVFAKRGMGYFATDKGSTDTRPRQDFSIPPNCNRTPCGSITGIVRTAEGGTPIANAVVEVKGPGDLVDTTAANGRYTIPRVPPHTYPAVVASASGHQPDTVTNVTVTAASQTRDFNLHRDWADVATGGQVIQASPPDLSSFGCGPSGAFDISLASGWGSTAINPDDPTNPGGAKSATVKLPRPVDVTAFAVDPGATCGDDDSAATRRLRVQTAKTTGAFTTVGTFNYTRTKNHKLNTVVPTTGKTDVRRVKITMLGTQGGGDAAANFMDLSEFQVYGTP